MNAEIPQDLSEHYEECGKYQNAHLILCRQLIERIANLTAENAAHVAAQNDLIKQFDALRLERDAFVEALRGLRPLLKEVAALAERSDG